MSGALPALPEVRDADGCGCCDGAGVETPAEVWNRAGLPAIAYRIGTHGSFKDSLVSRLSAAAFPALRALTTRDDGDPAIALLDAAATMADVLTFYQERIANESYLRTATEWRSLAAIGRLTGYEPSPGVAATAYLAFTLEDAPGAPEESAIPAGTRIQSVPPANALPQTFETLDEFTGRPEWNAMAAVTSQPPPAPDGSTATLLVQGIATGTRAGDRLVLTGPGGPWVRIAAAVTTDTAARTTRIDLQPEPPAWPPRFLFELLPLAVFDLVRAPLTFTALHDAVLTKRWDHADLHAYVRSKGWSASELMAGVIAAARAPRPVPTALDGTPGVFRFRQRAAVFGHNAPAYASLPASMKQTAAGAATATLTAGFVAGGVPGSEIIVGATVTNATIVGSTILNAVTPVAGGGVAGAALLGGVVEGGQVVGNAAAGAAYPLDWDANATTLNYAWDRSTLTPGPDGTPKRDNTHVALDHAYAGIGPGSLAVLEDGSKAEAFTVAAAADRSLAGFSLTGKSTELNLGAGADLGAFTRRGTTVFCDSEPLVLADLPVTEPVQGATIALARIYLGLTAGQPVAVSGVRADLPGVTGTEIATLASVIVSGNATLLNLLRPLAHPYVVGSVRVNANVVVATHGMAVAETLGSGDAGAAFQEFVLRQASLTFVADASAGGTRTTLSVRVNGEAWREVPSLYGAGPGDRVFATWLDEAGRTHVVFGDGVSGARLPTGAGNVTAQYRAGIGSAGLVGPGVVSLLMTRPLGVRSAANAVATSDAADPDSPDALRQTAPLHVLTLDRIVSLADYRDYARAYPGVTKAAATWQIGPRGRYVLLTVAGAAGAAVDPTGPLARSLVAAVRAISDPNVPVALGAYTPVFFQVGGALKIVPALVRDTVVAAAEAALQAAFALALRDFGQPVHQSEVVAAIQSVPGVIACDLGAFYRLDGAMTPGVYDVLQAYLPTSGASSLAPAEILLLDPRPIAFTALA